MSATGFDTSRDAKKAGFFSRRHRTSEPHDSAVAEYKSHRGREARRIRAKERREHGSSLTYDERFARLGVGCHIGENDTYAEGRGNPYLLKEPFDEGELSTRCDYVSKRIKPTTQCSLDAGHAHAGTPSGHYFDYMG